MWWISPSPVVVWGNSVFAYHWSLQTGIERFSGFWSGSPLKVVGGKERFQVSSHPVFQENGWRIFDRDLIKGEGLSPQKKNQDLIWVKVFSPQRIYVTLENVWSRKGDIPRFCPTQVLGWCCDLVCKQTVWGRLLVRQDHEKKTPGCIPENWWFPGDST